MARLGRRQPIGAQIYRGPVGSGTPFTALTDNFDDASIDTTKWPNNAGSVSESGGTAVVNCNTGYNSFQTAEIYTLIGSEIIVQLTPPAVGGGTIEVWAELSVTTTQMPTGEQVNAQVDRLNGLLRLRFTTGYAADGSAVNIAYDPVAHAWLRIRESNGTVDWSTSPTGNPSGWTIQRSAATPAWLTTTSQRAIMQAHREDGTDDTALYDNFNLPTADPPPPPPPPVYIRGKRRRPLPPGAFVTRTPDRRVPASSAIAVGLDGNLGVPLAVRIQTLQADRLLVAEVRDLQFRSTIPGGYASATISLSRPLNVLIPEIAMYARVVIYDTRSGEIVWEGSLEDPGRNAGSDGTTYQIAAVGPSAHTRDRTIPLVYIDKTLNHFERFGGSKISGDTGIGETAAGEPAVRCQAPDGTSWASGQYVAANSYRIANANMELARVRTSWVGGSIDTNWLIKFYIYPTDFAAATFTMTTTPAAGSLYSTTDWTPGENRLQLRIERTGSTETAGSRSVLWYGMTIRTRMMDEEGNFLAEPGGYANLYVLASEVVQDLIGRVLTQYDGPDAYIEETFTQIDQLAYADGVTAFEVLNDLMQIEEGMYWAAWAKLSTGKYRFEWLPWPVTPAYECDIQDGVDLPGSAADLFNEVRVRWKNEKGITQSTLVTNAVAVLTAAGRTRTAAIDLGEEIGSAVNAAAAGAAFLADHAVPANRGTLTIARPILDIEHGRMVWPWQIRPGKLIRVRGVHPRADALNPSGRDGVTIFRVVSTTFRASSASVDLELDGYSRTTAQAIAKLENKQVQYRR